MRSTTRQDYLDRICRVLRFVQEHLDEDLSPAILSDVANLSVYHFHRVFSGLVGESLAEHVRRLRLERAVGELCRTNRRVIDVALAAGYGAHEPFTRSFRAHFGMPPSAWREAGEPLVFPPVLCGVHYGPDEAVSHFVALEEDTKMIEVHIETVPARRLLALSHIGSYLDVGRMFERLMTAAGSRGLLGPDSKAIGIYYDDPETKPTAELRSHACVTVPASENEPPPGFEWLDLPGGEIALGLHKGPYDQLPHSYRWLFSQWLPSSGREAADRPCYETYLNDARTTPPEDLIRQISIPLVARKVATQSV
jgi:AraC family transcriptional regulator